MKLLEGKVAIVTGATKMKGLGRAIALKLAAQGAKIALTGRQNSKAGLDEVVDSLKAVGADAMGVLVDVSNQDEVTAAIQQVVDAYGSVDILVNNAGIGAGSPVFTENDDRAWDANYAVNVKGTMSMCRGALPHMEKAGGGAIVNVASLAGIGANPGMPYPYTATKFALVGVSKELALEYASKKIRVNVVCPGAIATDMLEQAYQAIAEAEGISIEDAAKLENSTIPVGRPAEPDEIADSIVYLASPAASYVTGVALPVAGGMSPGI
jgi:3-oxoacyl-[acyl-carrier protein] reductase